MKHISNANLSSFLKSIFLKKPYYIVISNTSISKLERTLSLFDLLCIGVGGTVGSGIFVLCGLIAREYAGPSVIFSWIIAGFGCMASALSYAELSCIIPSAGSSYAYVYVGLGELPAFLSAWCLTLEYGISGAAVASSWGNKVQEWINGLANNNISFNFNIFGIEINILGGLLQFLVVLMLLGGVDVSKRIVNSFTILKMFLVIFIIISGLSLYNSNNISTWIPFGVSGVFRGAASCFFGYIGYDEVCCMAAEAKDPQRVLPQAVLGTIAIVTVFYTLAALALIGMQNYQSIDSDSGFSNAFSNNNWLWAGQLVAVGEIVTLPLVVLVSFLAQPRLLYALSEDGLLSKRFSDLDSRGNMRYGIIVSGLVCIVITVIIPFNYLDDIISAGVLLSFNLTNTSLLMIRYNNDFLSINCRVQSDSRLSNKISKCVISYSSYVLLYHVLSIIICALLTVYSTTYQNNNIAMLLIIVVTVMILFITIFNINKLLYDNQHLYPSRYPYIYPSNNPTNHSTNNLPTNQHFQVPYVPFIPLFGILVNYYLIVQLSWQGLIGTLLYFIIAIAIYINYSRYHSIGNSLGWESYNDSYDILDSNSTSKSDSKDKVDGSINYSKLHSKPDIDDDSIVITDS